MTLKKMSYTAGWNPNVFAFQTCIICPAISASGATLALVALSLTIIRVKGAKGAMRARPITNTSGVTFEHANVTQRTIVNSTKSSTSFLKMATTMVLMAG